MILPLYVVAPPIFAADTSEEYCDMRRVPIVVYRKGYTTGVNDREPVDYVATTSKSRKKLYYFTEILGARKNTIEHHWYKNDKFITKLSFPIGADRWRIWSSKNLISRKGDKWEVKIYGKSGCLISRETILVGENEVIKHSKASDWQSPTQAVRSIISHSKKISPNEFKSFRGTKHLQNRGDYGDTPLLMAVRQNKSDAVVALLRANADPYIWDAVGETPLKIAKRKGNNAAIDALDDYMKKTPPVWAVTQATVSSGVDFHQAVDRYKSYAPAGVPLYFVAEHLGIRGRTIKHQWSYKNKVVAEHKYFIEANIWPTQSVYTIPTNHTGVWVLSIVDESGKVLKKIKLNIEKEKTTKSKPVDIQKRIPLREFVQLVKAWAPIEQITYLFKFDKGYRVSIEEAKEIIYAAIESGNIGMIKYTRILKWPIDKIYNERRMTPLIWAIEHKQYAMARYLIELGAGVNEKELTRGMTPMYFSIMQGRGDLVEYLLEKGADPTIKTTFDASSVDRAIYQCGIPILRIFKKHGVKFPTHQGGKPNSYWLEQCSNKNKWPKDLMFLWSE